ncbi:hypothetical protein [Virgisporangium aurantiacum]|uniref:Uncharacterized protein n=1 Tax=Virgisporangium aurantiacum TaxID=175570 RepID=A0A8J3ZJP1_9ACTN|nr:hypothetical protein [Virgisporangium aurantiacum]GIJ63225.1 hypothetical protein Vau01_107410 [Virgisporangium aurantiacum]
MRTDNDVVDLSTDRAAELSAEVELARLGFDAHRRGHVWFERKHYGPAIRFFRVAELCEVPDAEHDIDELELSNFERVAECRWRPVVEERAPRKPRYRGIFRFRGQLLAAASVIAVALMGVSLWPGSGNGSPSAATKLEQAPVASPTTLELSPVQQVQGQPVSPAPTAPIGRGQATTPTAPDRTASSPSSSPSAPAAPPTGATDPLGSHGPRYLGLPPSPTDEWRRLEFMAPEGTEFTARLVSMGNASCTWRFAGRASRDAPTTGSTTGEVVVAPRDHKDLNVAINGWPVFVVEATGAEPAACLLVDHDFVQTIENGGDGSGSGDRLSIPGLTDTDDPRGRSGPPSEPPSAGPPGLPNK